MKTLLELFNEFEEACQAMQSAGTRAMVAARDLRLAMAESASTKTEPCAPPEMAAHAPSTVPPSVDADSTESADDAPVAAQETGSGRTAREWIDSDDFDGFVKRNEAIEKLEPLKLTALCDAFLASVPATQRRPRWGKTFTKFFAQWVQR